MVEAGEDNKMFKKEEKALQCQRTQNKPQKIKHTGTFLQFKGPASFLRTIIIKL